MAADQNPAAQAKVWPGGKILAALPQQGACMTLDEVAAATGLPPERITRLVTALNRNGLISMAQRGCYRRTPAGDAAIAAGTLPKSGPRGPRGVPNTSQGGLAERLWRALRMLRRATLPELLEIADPRECRYDDHAARYLRQLKAAGVTGVSNRKVAGTALTSNGFKQHILLRDLGPKAPIWRQREKRLWDPNSSRYVDEIPS